MSFTLPNIPGARQTWGLQNNVAAYPSPFDGSVKLLKRPGATWQASVVWPAYRRNSSGYDKRATAWRVLDAFLAENSGTTFYVPDLTARTSTAPESIYGNIVLNGDFRNGADGLDDWTLSSNALAFADGGRVRVYIDLGTFHSLRQQVTTVVNRWYVYVLDSRAGTSPCRLRLGDVAGGLSLLNETAIPDGRNIGMFQATSTATHISLTVEGVVGDDAFYSGVSISACARVFGGSQTGSTLRVKDLPVGVTQGLVAGDKIEVNGELKTLTQDMTAYTTNTTAYLNITPPLRNSPADEAAVIFHRPCAKFIAPDFSYSRSDSTGNVGGFGIDLQEVF